MRVAFHFEVKPSYDDYIRLEDLFLRSLITLFGEDIHVKLHRGDLIVYDLIRGSIELHNVVDQLLDRDSLAWTSINPATLESKLATTAILVLMADGLTSRQASSLDRALADEPAYLGAIQLNRANPLHWGLYQQRLPLWARLVGTELRLLHTFDLGEDERDVAMFRHWEDTKWFKSVKWEDIGVQGTIFDPYSSWDRQRRVAELEESLSEHFTRLASEVLLRTHDLDPRLQDSLHAAFDAFRAADSPEGLAHAALSCRRFLQRLADAVYPARKEEVGGRKVGKQEYINRLWAYLASSISGSSKDLALASLEDLGHRVDRLDELANKGLHAEITYAEASRLLIALVTVTHEILLLAPAPTTPNLEPYNKEITEFLHEVLAHEEE